MYRIVVSLLLASVQVEGLHLPDYIKSCRKSDPNFNQCAKDAANNALPSIVKGDEQFGVPSLKPLKFSMLELTTDSLRMEFTDVEICGWENLHVNNLIFDVKENDGEMDVYIEELNFRAKYNISGEILARTVEGDGNIDLKLISGNYKLSSQFTYFKKDEVSYMKMENLKIKYIAKKMEFKLNNSFKGDEVLENQMSKYLNENWEAVNSELEPYISKAIATFYQEVVNAYITKIPADEVLPE